jgi:hypothetical protein
MHRVSITWKRHVGAYDAVCGCGASELHLRLSAAERWASGHRCVERSAHTFAATVFDVFGDMTIDVRDPPAHPTWHVAASGPAGHVGWDTTDTPPAKETRITVTIAEGEPMTDDLMQRLRQRSAVAADDECSEAANRIVRLEDECHVLAQRIVAAIAHMEEAQGWVDASCCCEAEILTELVAAIDVLRGEAS